MAIKICPICGKEYDDELNEVCPFCDSDKKEEVTQQSNFEQQNVVSGDNQTETDTNVGTSKGLKIVASILAAVLVVLICVFVYIKFFHPSGDAVKKENKNYVSDIIEVTQNNSKTKTEDKISVKDLDGTFSDDVNHIYYTFNNVKTNIEIPVETEEVTEPSADSAADSAAQTQTVVTSSQTVEYDGTYTTGMTQKGIRRMVIIEYIQSTGLVDAYMEYYDEKGSVTDDFEGFIKDKKLEADVNLFDSENGLSQKYAFEKEEGFWKSEGDIIYLFDSDGNEVEKYMMTDTGLVNMSSLYEGKVSSKDSLCAVYSSYMEEYGITESFRLYRDGYFVIETKGSQEGYMAGTYIVDEKGAYLNINGQNVFFYVTDLGICTVVLTK